MAAWTLVLLVVRRVLATVDVTQAELLIARHSDLFLIADACARILYQVLPRLARESLVVVPAIAVLWIVAATLGRGLTLQAMPAAAPGARPTRFGQLALLNTMRCLFTLVTGVALFGGLLLAGMTIPVTNLAALVSVTILLVTAVSFCWSVVNWFLALAPIWIVHGGGSAGRAIVQAVELSRRMAREYSLVGFWFGVFRGVAFVIAFVAALLAAEATPAAAIAGCVAIALMYFAAADFLYIARLAAYVELEESSRRCPQ